MSRPVLGIIACTRVVGVEPAQAVMNRYVEAAMRHADAAALIVPSLPDLMHANELVDRLDGLLLTGTPSNVAPALYGHADVADAEGPYDPARDRMTAALIETMTSAGKPVFGVCRGLQEINVAFGGTLRRDMGVAPDLIAHHAADDVDFDAMFDHVHEVTLAPGGVLVAAFGTEAMAVNSVHYQGVDRLGAGLHVEARAADGVVEAFSTVHHGAPVVAVQWHPEWHADANPQSQIYFHLLGRALRGEPIEGLRA